jgi:hypothetical protein
LNNKYPKKSAKISVPISVKPYSQVVDLSRCGIMWPRWCVDGRMNIVHNLLDKYIGTPVENRTALIWEGEEGADAPPDLRRAPPPGQPGCQCPAQPGPGQGRCGGHLHAHDAGDRGSPAGDHQNRRHLPAAVLGLRRGRSGFPPGGCPCQSPFHSRWHIPPGKAGRYEIGGRSGAGRAAGG